MRAPLVSIPFERDEGEYAYIAQRALQGDIPYRDTFDQKPPGVFAIYVVALLTAGRTVGAIHLFLCAWVLLTVWLLCRLVTRLADATAGLLAALALTVMISGAGVLGNAGNTEVFTLLPVVGSLLCVASAISRAGAWRLIAAGVLAASAFWIKQTAIMNVVFIAGWLAVTHFAQSPSRRIGRLALEACWLLLGATFLTAPIILYFLAHGALRDFFYCVFAYNFDYASSGWESSALVWERFAASSRRILSSDWPLWACALGGIWVLVRKGRRSLVVLLTAWLLLSFAGVCFGGYFRPHYFMQILPAAAALAGVGLAWVVSIVARAQIIGVRLLGYGLVFGAVVGNAAMANGDILFAPSPSVASIRLYGPTPFVFSRALGSELRAKTSPGDTILVAGTEPQIAYFAERKNATRYIFFNPLAAQYVGVLENQKQALEEIRRNRPRYIVNLLPIYGGTIVTSQTEMHFFRELDGYIREEGFEPESYILAVPEQLCEDKARCYQMFSPQQVADHERRTGEVFPGTVLLRRP
jgi:hypothetical protein